MAYEVFYTGCLKQAPMLEKLNYAVVCIQTTKPAWFKGVHFPQLAPPVELLLAKEKKLIDYGVFKVLFMKYLRSLDAHNIIRTLRRFAPDTDIVALLADSKFDTSSHRFIVGEWLTGLGYPTKESDCNYINACKQSKLF